MVGISTPKIYPEDSGIPTEMKVSGANIIPVGKIVEIGKNTTNFRKPLEQELFTSNTATFKQKFKLKDASKPADVNVEIIYQTCNDRVCLAPNTLEFEEKIKANLTETNSKENEQTPLQEAVKDTVNQNTNLTSAENTTPSAQALQGENS